MFFAKVGEFEACGLYTSGHWLLIALTLITILVALIICVLKHVDVNKVIKRCTITMLILEVLIISFKIYHYGFESIEEYLPLYFCSMLLYSGTLSSFAKGKLKRIGDVFLATGGLFAGICYIISPTTSLMIYPTFHLISLHAFLFHGMMIFLGLLINVTNYVDIKLKDFIYYVIIVGILCLIALIINPIYDSNFMFVSKDFPGTIVGDIYHATGKFFTPIAVLIQLTVPFFSVFLVKRIVDLANTLFLKEKTD